MTPAKKRLGTDQGGIHERNLGLEMKFELVLRECRAEIGAQRDTVAHAPVQNHVIRAYSKPASRLGRVHGRIGLTQQRLGGFGVFSH